MKKVFMLLDKHLEEILLVFGTMVMILLIFYQVVMRRCFNSSIAWSEELARYIFIWQVWLAVPYTVTKGRHIRLEVLLDVVKPKGRFVLDMIFFLVSAFFFGYIGHRHRRQRDQDGTAHTGADDPEMALLSCPSCRHDPRLAAFPAVWLQTHHSLQKGSD